MLTFEYTEKHLLRSNEKQMILFVKAFGQNFHSMFRVILSDTYIYVSLVNLINDYVRHASQSSLKPSQESAWPEK